LSSDPRERPFANLGRLADGSLNEDALVKILTESIEDKAGAFGSRNIPEILRSVEILGIKQARSWNLATLNEFRAFLT
jgi:linoleate 8R-lipoxygenase/9,12-octadecadienoate 8-hydroperoxide 8R-isomerase